MTEPPRTLEERLRERIEGAKEVERLVPCPGDRDPTQPMSALLAEAADALDARSQLLAATQERVKFLEERLAFNSSLFNELLAEARETLEPFAKQADSYEAFTEDSALCSDIARRLYVRQLRKARAFLANLKAATKPEITSGT